MTETTPNQTLSGGSSQGEDQRAENNFEKDSLYILPLSMIPLETSGLKRAKLLKNARLESVVELYHDDTAGSGQLYPDQLMQLFDWPKKQSHPDLTTIKALSRLYSYDVYSLRIELRRMNLQVNDYSEFRLSEQKNKELAKYMGEFTRPLIRQVYGRSDSAISDVSELIGMFSKPNKEEAVKNLKLMADKLEISIQDVPAFLEDYGDIFLSLAYFKESLDEIVPSITDFVDNLDELHQNYQLSQNRNFVTTCDSLKQKLNDVTASITGRFESFDRHSQDMWEHITADSFRRIKELIKGHHTTVGGVLCGLTVKMNAWNEKFGHGQGGPLQRSDFILSDMTQGMDFIAKIEDEAPKISLI